MRGGEKDVPLNKVELLRGKEVCEKWGAWYLEGSRHILGQVEGNLFGEGVRRHGKFTSVMKAVLKGVYHREVGNKSPEAGKKRGFHRDISLQSIKCKKRKSRQTSSLFK